MNTRTRKYTSTKKYMCYATSAEGKFVYTYMRASNATEPKKHALSMYPVAQGYTGHGANVVA